MKLNEGKKIMLYNNLLLKLINLSQLKLDLGISHIVDFISRDVRVTPASVIEFINTKAPEYYQDKIKSNPVEVLKELDYDIYSSDSFVLANNDIYKSTLSEIVKALIPGASLDASKRMGIRVVTTAYNAQNINGRDMDSIYGAINSIAYTGKSASGLESISDKSMVTTISNLGLHLVNSAIKAGEGGLIADDELEPFVSDVMSIISDAYTTLASEVYVAYTAPKEGCVSLLHEDYVYKNMFERSMMTSGRMAQLSTLSDEGLYAVYRVWARCADVLCVRHGFPKGIVCVPGKDNALSNCCKLIMDKLVGEPSAKVMDELMPYNHESIKRRIHALPKPDDSIVEEADEIANALNGETITTFNSAAFINTLREDDEAMDAYVEGMTMVGKVRPTKVLIKSILSIQPDSMAVRISGGSSSVASIEDDMVKELTFNGETMIGVVLTCPDLLNVTMVNSIVNTLIIASDSKVNINYDAEAYNMVEVYSDQFISIYQSWK